MSFPSVSQVECKSIGGIAGDALLNLFYCFPSLRSLKLYDCLAVDDALLASVSDRLQMLKDVSVSKSSQLKNVEIGSTKLTIRHLTLSMCPTLSMINVPMSLISIVLSGTAVTDAAVSGVVKVCTAIILIDVSHCHALRDLTINSSTIAILNFDYSSSLRSLCVECPLLQSIGVSGCASLVQLVLCSGSICHIDLTMLKSLKCVELRCDHLQSLLACGCENMKYFGRYLSEDYKRITLGIVLASCPFLRLGNGDCLAGCPLYDEYINSFGI